MKRRALRRVISFVLGAHAAFWSAGAKADPTAIPTPVAELEVVAKGKCVAAEPDPEAPTARVVSSFPGEGAAVRSGVLVVRLTFDRPMTCNGFIVAAPPEPNPCPLRRQHMSISYDHRTLWILCATKPNTTYALQLGVKTEHRFESLEGRPAEPFRLSFTTTDAPPTDGVLEALDEDKAQGRSGRTKPSP